MREVFNEELLTGLLDQQLTERERQIVTAALERDQSLQRRLEELRRVREALRRLPVPALPADWSTAVANRIDAGGVTNVGDLQATTDSRPNVILMLALAASVLLAVGWVLWQQRSAQPTAAVFNAMDQTTMAPMVEDSEAAVSEIAAADPSPPGTSPTEPRPLELPSLVPQDANNNTMGARRQASRAYSAASESVVEPRLVVSWLSVKPSEISLRTKSAIVPRRMPSETRMSGSQWEILEPWLQESGFPVDVPWEQNSVAQSKQAILQVEGLPTAVQSFFDQLRQQLGKVDTIPLPTLSPSGRATLQLKIIVTE